MPRQLNINGVACILQDTCLLRVDCRMDRESLVHINQLTLFQILRAGFLETGYITLWNCISLIMWYGEQAIFHVTTYCYFFALTAQFAPFDRQISHVISAVTPSLKCPGIHSLVPVKLK